MTSHRTDLTDVVMPREAFIRSICRPLVTFWESPALVDNWRQWADDTEEEGIEVDENGYRLHPYPLRSPVLDRFLSGSAASGAGAARWA